MEFIIV